MWLLLVDVFTAGPLGPNPRVFAVGVIIFLGGWGLTKVEGRRPKVRREMGRSKK